MGLHAERLHFQRQCGQQLAVVELALTGQQHAAGKARRQCRFDFGQPRGVERLHGGEFWHLLTRGGKLLAQARGVGGVLAVPDDQRAFLLEEHRARQRAQDVPPARERIAPHAHHAVLGDGRFGQRRQHAAGDAGGRMLALGPAQVVNGDLVAGARQRDSKQPAHEPGAQDGKRGWL